MKTPKAQKQLKSSIEQISNYFKLCLWFIREMPLKAARDSSISSKLVITKVQKSGIKSFIYTATTIVLNAKN